MTNEKDREDAREMCADMSSVSVSGIFDPTVEKFVLVAADRISRIRAEAVTSVRSEDHTRRWNFEKTDDGIRVCFGEHDRSADCEYVEYVPKSSIDEAVKAERERMANVIKSAIEQRRLEYEEKHIGVWHSFEYSEGLLNSSDIVEKIVLSDDQEAKRDSRIREVLEEARRELTCGSANRNEFRCQLVVNKIDDFLTAEPDPCEDARWRTCPDCGARYPITPIEKLGDEEYDGPTQYFVQNGELRTPRVYGSRQVICACRASQVADKRAEELRAHAENAFERGVIEGESKRAILEVRGRDAFLSGIRAEMDSIREENNRLREALAATEPKPCTWTEEVEGGIWDTSCGEAYVFEDGDPDENHHRYCSGCGRPIKQVPMEVEDDDVEDDNVMCPCCLCIVEGHPIVCPHCGGSL